MMKDSAVTDPAQACHSILLVCLGNICRSPLAEGLLRAALAERGIADAVVVDSAGTGGWHAGSPPDPRSIEVARRNGVDISAQRARRVSLADFSDYDLILGMDSSNVDELRRVAPAGARDRIHLLTQYALGRSEDVPDPYFGGPDGFDGVYRMLRTASAALAEKLVGGTVASRSGQASSTM